MRILILATAYIPHVGGAEVAVKEITKRLERQFEMITVRLKKADAAEEQVGNIKVYRLGFGLGRIDKYFFPFRAARLANKLHRQNHYDVVWSIMASWSGFAALFFCKNSSVKFLLTLQEGDDLRVPVRKSLMVHHWFKQIFQRADYIQCISSYLADWAKKMGATCPIEVVPNGVDLEKYQISNIKYQTNHKSQNQNSKIILTTSRLVQKNGIVDLIEATALLITHYSSPVTLVICGDGEERKKLEVKSKQLGIADEVKFMGFVKPEELPKFYAIADVFCRPSLSEGLGNSFLEAMAAGVPVVATPVGGIPDFLRDGKTGWFCRVNDPASIAEKIKYILDEQNKAEAQKVINNAKQMVLDKYDWDGIAGQMENIFKALK
ncbi:hypothetical protein COU01_01365 [Candidatus Falkowbacteria bacterium CG10_big_fil_rev_8_21_14_0_10_44_15]|uniref:Glycosyltransferase family 1 protein n=1 Tax=Candidatus Falkowbacteria bacterium CG10_big_fil_rev_8_21_14_0_10_44_15 TaxID=1974569 RepID=A0A2H0V0A1_9BACT|nr:MAG: hypothetical protein COU01_01365 [Candidatus Falkowbacteria bacterium CG10_big_fil_rev_8_21_14_0_10_44_15]